MSIHENRKLIRRYYEDLWSDWNFGIADQLLSKDIRFRGSLGIEVQGLTSFIRYMDLMRGAFPDFFNTLEQLIAEEDIVAARLTYTGTHRGEFLGFKATGKRITYSGAAIFKIMEGKIAEGWVLGDMHSLMGQLTSVTPVPRVESREGLIGIGPANDEERLWAASLMATSEPWLTLQRSAEQCRRACQNPDHLLFTARAGEQLCGFLLARRRGVAESPYIKSLAVDPQFRGRGIGMELLRFAEDLFAAESNHIFLCVSSFNERAMRFYEKNGYACIGRLRNYIVQGADEILMHKQLNGSGPPAQPENQASQLKSVRPRGRYKGKAVNLI